MTLNLDKYKDALVGAYREVMDEKNPINWALYSYEGQSFDLILVSKGDGGLEELNEDFNSGKIMYALCRVKVKEKNVEKIVLINWQGEGAPLSRKGMSANHLGTIRSYFKGIHVSINARTEEDVEPDTVEATVAKAIAGEGVKMSSNIEAEGQIGPVGTCYKRVNPLEEINSSAKDEFWRREEQEEVRRKKEEQTKLRKFSQNEVKLLRRESQDYFHEQERESISATSSSSVSPQPLTPTTKVNGLSSTINSASVAAVKASTPRKNSTGNSGDLVRQRIKSFDNGSPPQSTINYAGNGLSNGSNGTKESLSVLKRKQLFESGGASNTINTVVRKNPAQEIKTALSQQESKPPQPLNRPPQSPQPAKQVETIKSDEKFVPINNQNKNVEPTPTTIPAVINKSPSPQPSVIINKSYSPPPQVVQMRQQQPSPTPPSTQENFTPVNGGYNGYIPPPLAVEEPTNNYYEDNTVQSAEQRTASPLPDEGRLTPSMTIEITPEMGLCARALYDYQAADDSEITFDPGEVITNIERIDEGWWEGAGPRGTYGLFPANYVEVLNP